MNVRFFSNVSEFEILVDAPKDNIKISLSRKKLILSQLNTTQELILHSSSNSNDYYQIIHSGETLHFIMPVINQSRSIALPNRYPIHITFLHNQSYNPISRLV